MRMVEQGYTYTGSGQFLPLNAVVKGKFNSVVVYNSVTNNPNNSYNIWGFSLAK